MAEGFCLGARVSKAVALPVHSVTRLGEISPIGLLFEVFGEFFDKKNRPIIGLLFGRNFCSYFFVENCDI